MAGKDAVVDTSASYIERKRTQNFQTIIAKFDKDCNEKTNIISEKCHVLQSEQQTVDSFNKFVASFRTLISICQYFNPDQLFTDQYVLRLREKKRKIHEEENPI